MTNENDRLQDLELKFVYQDDLLEQLNEVVTKQQMVIDKLHREIEKLKESMMNNGGSQFKDAVDEPPPPHY